MENILIKTLNLVFSSRRLMPAHFNTSEKRDASFAIDFELLTEEDDVEMAHSAFFNIKLARFNEEQYYPLLKFGEDVMIGSFILACYRRLDLIDKMIELLRKDIIELQNHEGIEYFESHSVMIYINFCKEFGIKRAAMKDKNFRFNYFEFSNN